ncbi:hypothetical protein C0J52_16528 [Blattella germanica]|nr:hypothetical protein C0J52_16528 [Blattella germanica]
MVYASGVGLLPSRRFLLHKRELLSDLWQVFGIPSLARSTLKKILILSFPSLFIIELSIFLFNNRGRFTKVNTCHQYNTRSGNDFYISFNRLNLTINSPYVLGLKLFNNLPLEIKNVNEPNVFKK